MKYTITNKIILIINVLRARLSETAISLSCLYRIFVRWLTLLARRVTSGRLVTWPGSARTASKRRVSALWHSCSKLRIVFGEVSQPGQSPVTAVNRKELRPNEGTMYVSELANILNIADAKTP